MSAEPCHVEVEPEAEPAPGDVIAGKYRVERIIGRGGMGIVIAAMHEHLCELVAIKLIRSGSGMETKDAVARFLREARAIVKIKSPYVAKLFDVDTLANGMPYMVMEYLEGRNLAKEFFVRGALPIEEAVDYTIQACLALAAAHDLGVVHRDLKPSNLFLTQGAKGSKHLKVLDFGISKILAGSSVDAAEETLTAPHSIMGSPSYMSPEQIRDSKDVDQRADIWSVGVILYELLAGRRPFSAGTPQGILASICADPPAPLLLARPEVPAELARIIEGCLQKPRDKRPQSVSALQEALLPFASARMQSICAHAVDVPLSRPSASARVDQRGLNEGDPSTSRELPTRNERGPASSSAPAPLSWIESGRRTIGPGLTLRNSPQPDVADKNNVSSSSAEPSIASPAAPQHRQHAALMFMAGIIATLAVSVVALLAKLEKPPLPSAQAGVSSTPESNPRAIDAPYGINVPSSEGDAPTSAAPGASVGSASPREPATAPATSSGLSGESPALSETTTDAASASRATKVSEASGGGSRSRQPSVVPRPEDKALPSSSDDEDSRH